MRRVLVGNNQSIWDLAVQEYGSLDGIKQLMIDNPTKCNLESSIPAGTELLIREIPLNKAIYEFFSKKRIKPATAIDVPTPAVWILATGLWNDSGFWDDNALWID